MRARFLAFLLAFVLAVGSPALAWAGAAEATIQSFSATLLDVMKDGPALGFSGRSAKLRQPVADLFDMVAVTKSTLGAGAAKLSPDESGKLIEAYLASGVKGPLVIVGKKAWKSEGELRLLFNDHIQYLQSEGPYTFTRHRVMQLEYAPFPLLVSLIRGARGVLFPSLYEGFGLPVLEAMLLGAPVMTSNTSSLPELVGDAALTVDPYNTAAMAQAIQALDSDAALRARLSAAAPLQADLFNPSRYQDRLQALYARLGA